MSKKLSLKVDKRELLGTGESRRMRRQGVIPAVVYGHGKDATAISASVLEIQAAIQRPGLISLKLTGRRTGMSVILKEAQRDAITGRLLHVDFQEVKADELITTMVPIEPHGEPNGHQHGGQLEQILHELEVRCLPAAMFEGLVVDVTLLEVDDALHVRDLVLPEGVTATADADLPVFQVRLPRVEVEEEEEGAEEEEGEPGLVGEEESEETESEG